jgi:hypothetical protein
MSARSSSSRRSDATMLWFPVHTHPSGAAREPWYSVIGDRIYRTATHPSGASARPIFRIDGDNVFVLDEELVQLRDAPSFVVKDSMVFPADAHPLGASNKPWYQARVRDYTITPTRT